MGQLLADLSFTPGKGCGETNDQNCLAHICVFCPRTLQPVQVYDGKLNLMQSAVVEARSTAQDECAPRGVLLQSHPGVKEVGTAWWTSSHPQQGCHLGSHETSALKGPARV